jgi:phage regulator Rha-like protein
MSKKFLSSTINVEQISQFIYIMRGYKVMLDADLAKLYGIETRNLNKAVSRNKDRFPEDFVFRLTLKEWNALMFQNGTSNELLAYKSQSEGRGGRRKLPLVFTEHGAVMAANVLRSKKAITMSVEIVRAFIRLRQALACHKELSEEVAHLKNFVLKHSQQSDQEFRKVWKVIEKLSMPIKPEEKRRIGFQLN